MTTLRTPSQLCERGLTPSDRLPGLQAVAARYAVALPETLARLIDCNDPNDPIARQFIPDAGELDQKPGEISDPIGDEKYSPIEGIVHRYPDRVLLKVTHICAVYCRFCFRRESVGLNRSSMLSPKALAGALDYVRTHPEIWEVILTGGDPLILSARRLRALVRNLANIEHVKIMRIHTRVPVADPARITADLVRAIKVKGKPTYVAVHVNHPRELTAQARAACARLADAGIPLLSQTVLLAGVNDTPEVLGELMRALVECRIKPYYLHHGDLAPGTARLRTDIATGQQLMRNLRGRYSGLCQPTYVLDVPGGYGKSPIGPSYINGDVAPGFDHCMVEDFNGQRHVYPPLRTGEHEAPGTRKVKASRASDGSTKGREMPQLPQGSQNL